ncbi:ABC transporter permease, partial [Rhodoferax sp. 4810]|nr:ABC transporter permease [Rhodoferax jenense]
MKKLQDLVGPTNSRLLLILVAMVIGLGMAEGEKLFGAAGLRSMAFQLPELGFLALAMMIPMLSGGIDLSIIATANLCALAMAYLLTTWMPETQGLTSVLVLVLVFLIGLFLAMAVGLLNGTLVAYFRVHPMLATLGT